MQKSLPLSLKLGTAPSPRGIVSSFVLRDTVEDQAWPALLSWPSPKKENAASSWVFLSSAKSLAQGPLQETSLLAASHCSPPLAVPKSIFLSSQGLGLVK